MPQKFSSDSAGAAEGQDVAGPTLNEITLRLQSAAPLAEQALMSGGGWRGLLDPFSDEWRWTSLQSKRRLFAQLHRAGFLPSQIVEVYCAEHEQRGRPDLAIEAEVVLIKLDLWPE